MGTAQVHGSVTYNGQPFNSFVVEQTASFVHQSDLHLPEVTVRETLDFGARVQGIGFRGGALHVGIKTWSCACRSCIPTVDKLRRAALAESMNHKLYEECFAGPNTAYCTHA